MFLSLSRFGICCQVSKLIFCSKFFLEFDQYCVDWPVYLLDIRLRSESQFSVEIFDDKLA